MVAKTTQGTTTMFVIIAYFSCFTDPVLGVISCAWYDGKSKKMEVTCEASAMVQILRASYGYSSGGNCRVKDRSQDEEECSLLEADDFGCNGQSACSVPLPRAEKGGPLIPHCQRTSNYFQLVYQCVPRHLVHDFCLTNTLRKQNGHIVTPNFPAVAVRNIKPFTCNLTIHVQPTQTLRLNIITMQLRNAGKTECQDWLYMSDRRKTVTMCGDRSNVWYNIDTNVLYVEIKQDVGFTANKGVWLYYEAWPPISTERTTVASTPTINNRPTTLIKPHSSILTILRPKGDKTTKKTHLSVTTPFIIPVYNEQTVNQAAAISGPIAAVAGSVVGTICLLFLLLLLSLLVRWLKEREHVKPDKMLEIRNPVFRSNSNCQQANNAYYQ